MDYRVSNVTAGFMITIAVLLDALQFFLTLLVFTALFADLVTFLAIPMFGIWFMLLRINYFGGRKSSVKIASVFISSIVELIPVIDALPGITVGVLGVIYASRSEDKIKEKERAAKTVQAGKAQAANDNARYARYQAANDNQAREEQEEAA